MVEEMVSQNCYIVHIKSALNVAMDNDCHSIGFPLISAGIYGYPLEGAWEQAISACKDFIVENPIKY